MRAPPNKHGGNKYLYQNPAKPSYLAGLAGSKGEHGTQCEADTLEFECAHESSGCLVKIQILTQGTWDGA